MRYLISSDWRYGFTSIKRDTNLLRCRVAAFLLTYYILTASVLAMVPAFTSGGPRDGPSHKLHSPPVGFRLAQRSVILTWRASSEAFFSRRKQALSRHEQAAGAFFSRGEQARLALVDAVLLQREAAVASGSRPLRRRRHSR